MKRSEYVTLTSEPNDNLILGKERIIEDFIEVPMRSGVDLKSLALGWHDNRIHHRCALTIRHGKDRYALSFTECDVVGWPHFQEIAMKYSSIHSTVEKLKASEQLAEKQPLLQIGYRGSPLKAG